MIRILRTSGLRLPPVYQVDFPHSSADYLRVILPFIWISTPLLFHDTIQTFSARIRAKARTKNQSERVYVDEMKGKQTHTEQ